MHDGVVHALTNLLAAAPEGVVVLGALGGLRDVACHHLSHVVAEVFGELTRCHVVQPVQITLVDRRLPRGDAEVTRHLFDVVGTRAVDELVQDRLSHRVGVELFDLGEALEVAAVLLQRLGHLLDELTLLLGEDVDRPDARVVILLHLTHRHPLHQLSVPARGVHVALVEQKIVEQVTQRLHSLVCLGMVDVLQLSTVVHVLAHQLGGVLVELDQDVAHLHLIAVVGLSRRFEEALLLAAHVAFHAEEHLAQRLDVRVGRVFEHAGGRVDTLLEELVELVSEGTGVQATSFERLLVRFQHSLHAHTAFW